MLPPVVGAPQGLGVAGTDDLTLADGHGRVQVDRVVRTEGVPMAHSGHIWIPSELCSLCGVHLLHSYGGKNVV